MKWVSVAYNSPFCVSYSAEESVAPFSSVEYSYRQDLLGVLPFHKTTQKKRSFRRRAFSPTYV